MTLRERLADWISGGALTRARAEAIANHEETLECAEDWVDAYEALEAIEEATRNGKSGTARKVHRMATEALK